MLAFLNGCEGCQSRKDIIGAGEWKTDLLVVLVAAAGVVGVYFLMKESK